MIKITNKLGLSSLVFAMSTMLVGCVQGDVQSKSTQVTQTQDENSDRQQSVSPFAMGVVHAINVGGNEYHDLSGIVYSADKIISGETRTLNEAIKGTQNPTLFQSYRQGELEFSLPVEDGTFALTFLFAEPNESAQIGQRVFDVLVNDQVVIPDLDILPARDVKPLSALTRSVSNIQSEDGKLNIKLQAKVGEPVLNGVIVRKSVQDTRNWSLIFQDEFNQDGKPDPSKWSYNIWPAGQVNDEDQAYTDRLKNARVENGNLIIEAHKEEYGNAQYTSARLLTKGKADFLYGKVEMRIKVPAGQGTWPAAWMMPTDFFKYATTCSPGGERQGDAKCDAWPNSGEIDILEHVGYDMNRVHGTVHTKSYYWVNFEQRKGSIEAEAVSENFRLYSLEWTPEYIFISYDDIPYFYYHNEGEGWEAWPFDHPYHIILNLAIGGGWGGAGGPTDDSIFPVRMEVDYVRIYQLADDN